MEADELVNKPLVKHWAAWALFWLVVFLLAGLLILIKFHSANYPDSMPWLSFRRLRPLYIRGIIFGAFSMSFIGLLYYYVPRLCGVRMYKEEWGWWFLWVWNAFIFVGSISIMIEYNSSLETKGYEWPFNILCFIALCMIAIQILGTILLHLKQQLTINRKEDKHETQI